jgi:tripartite-type tricarboxylate transporter receptor subunit TctC
MHSRRRFIASCLACTSASRTFAQRSVETERPLTLFVPFAPGGPSDTLARAVSAPLSAREGGRAVVVENVSGASGSLGVQKMLAAPRDGSAVLLASPSETILAPLLQRSLRYQAEDLRLLAMPLESRSALVARPGLGINSLGELRRQGASNANIEWTFGNVGTGSTHHLATADFARRIGLRVQHVPYRGSAPLLQDLVGNRLDMAFLAWTDRVRQMVAAGQLQLVGIASRTNMPAIERSLTAHAPLETFVFPLWNCFAVARAVSGPTAQRLHLALSDVLRAPEVTALLMVNGIDVPASGTLEQLDAYYAKEIARLKSLATATGLLT